MTELTVEEIADINCLLAEAEEFEKPDPAEVLALIQHRKDDPASDWEFDAMIAEWQKEHAEVQGWTFVAGSSFAVNKDAPQAQGLVAWWPRIDEPGPGEWM